MYGRWEISFEFSYNVSPPRHGSGILNTVVKPKEKLWWPIIWAKDNVRGQCPDIILFEPDYYFPVRSGLIVFWAAHHPLADNVDWLIDWLIRTFSVYCPYNWKLTVTQLKWSQPKSHQLRTRSACCHKEAQWSTGHIWWHPATITNDSKIESKIRSSRCDPATSWSLCVFWTSHEDET